MKWLYLFLAIIGVILPYTALIPFIQENGNDMVKLFSMQFNEHGTTFFAYDLLLAGTVATIFMIVEGAKKKVKGYGFAVAGVFLVGVCFGLPFFLYLREAQGKG